MLLRLMTCNLSGIQLKTEVCKASSQRIDNMVLDRVITQILHLLILPKSVASNDCQLFFQIVSN